MMGLPGKRYELMNNDSQRQPLNAGLCQLFPPSVDGQADTSAQIRAGHRPEGHFHDGATNGTTRRTPVVGFLRSIVKACNLPLGIWSGRGAGGLRPGGAAIQPLH